MGGKHLLDIVIDSKAEEDTDGEVVSVPTAGLGPIAGIDPFPRAADE